MDVEIRINTDIAPGGTSARRVTTFGRVFDDQNAPTGGASIRIRQPNGMQIITQSGPDGSYSMTWEGSVAQPAPLEFVVAQNTNRHLTLLQRIDVSSTNLDLHLQPAVSITARLKDPEGQAIASGSVLLRLVQNRITIPTGALGGASDELGMIELKDLPAGCDYKLAIRAKGFRSADLDVPEAAAGATILQLPDIVLQPAETRDRGPNLGSGFDTRAGRDCD